MTDPVTDTAASVAHMQNCGHPLQSSTFCPGCRDEAARAWGVRLTVDELRFVLQFAKFAPGALICQDRQDDGSCGGDCPSHALLADLEARCDA